MAVMNARSEIDDDQRIVLYGKTWADYEAQLALRGEGGRPKLAFLDGALELMTTSRKHGATTWRVGQVLTQYCMETEIEISGMAEWTLKDQSKDAGGESDVCFTFSDHDRERIPDLVIEVIVSHGGIDKLEIYRRLGVREVWFWEDDEIAVYTLERGTYARRERSTFVPDLDLALVCRLANVTPGNEMLRQLRIALGH